MGVPLGGTRRATGRKLALVASLALSGVLATAGPAAAHAELRASQPVDGQALDTSPRNIVLRFNEPVEVAFGAIRLYDGSARRVTVGSPRHPAGDTRSVAVPVPDLRPGAYVVTWRVSSADAHNIRGALTFRVGPAPAGAGTTLARRLLAAEGGSALVGLLSVIARTVAFAALATLVGGAVFLAVVWRGGFGEGRVRRVLWVGWAALVATTAAGVGLQGASAGGLGVADAVRPSLVFSVLDTRFGRLSLLRLLLLLAAAVLVVAAVRRRLPRAVGQAALAVAGLGVVATVSLSGHAASGRWVPAAVAADIVHLVAVSVWLGGLALLGGYVLRSPNADVAAAEPVARRFSSMAGWAVALIVATGVFQALRQVAELPALVETAYGRLLLAKVALVAAMVALGARSRSWLRRRHRAGSVATPALSPGPGASPVAPPPALRDLRRWVRVEAAVAAAVLVAAGLLVGAVPARTAYGRPFSAELDARRLLIDVTVDPAKAGPVDVHVYTLGRTGQVTDVAGMEAELRLPARDVGPLRVPLRRAGAGHFAAYGFSLPLPGRWELTLTTELQDGSERVALTVPVR